MTAGMDVDCGEMLSVATSPASLTPRHINPPKASKMSELTKALIKFHQQVGTIHKDSKAQYGAYADLAGVLSTVTPVLSANGLAIVQTFLEDSLVTELYHESGEKISSCMKLIVVPGRNELHSTGASITYLRRYMICAILGIVADMDTDGVVPEPVEKPVEKTKPAAKKRVAKKAAPVETAAADLAKATEGEVVQTEQPLPKEEYEAVLAVMKDLFGKDKKKFTSIQQAFMTQFQVPEGVKFSEAITTQAHVEFINGNL